MLNRLEKQLNRDFSGDHKKKEKNMLCDSMPPVGWNGTCNERIDLAVSHKF